jgi:chemotaxis signal transduction protein
MTAEKPGRGFRLGLIPSTGGHSGLRDDKPGLVSFVVFGVGSQSFAVDVNNTEGVVDCPGVAPLPRPPAGIVGVASVRGRITVVFDLSFQDRKPAAQGSRLILIRGDAQIGLLADRIDSIVGLKPDKVKRLSKKRAPLNELADSYLIQHRRQVPIIAVDRLTTLGA